MLKAEYLGTGTYKVDKFKHLDDNQLLVTAYPYRTRQNVLNELVANAVVGGGFPYSCRDIEAVLKQVLNELPDNYNSFTGKDSRFCIKLSW
jgi:capsid portal protein